MAGPAPTPAAVAARVDGAVAAVPSLRWIDRGWLALLGGLVAAGQAPLGAWYVALPALWLVIRRVAAESRPRHAALAALFAGAGHFAAALFWIVEPFFVEPWRHGWMAPFALPMMAFGMALFWAGAGWGAALLGRTPARRALALAVCLAAGDALRGYVFTGFPWALFGHVWIGTPVAQAAALAGSLGLSLATTLAAALPAIFGLRGAAAALALVAGLWAGGAWRLAQPVPPPDRPVTLRIVQPNAAQHLKWQPGMAEVFFQRLLDHSAAPAEGPEPDLVIWPETAVPWLFDAEGALPQAIAAGAGGRRIVLGLQRAEGARYYNSLAVLDGAGRLQGLYDKHHLVPFGEYLPAGDLLARVGISAFAAQAGHGYSAGPGPALLDLGAGLGRVLPLICYEAVFPQELTAARHLPGPPPGWILQATNDAWFGSLSGPFQHLAQARLRAIEQGLPLIRAANTGVSAAIDARGRVLAALPLNEEGHLDIALPGALPPPPYARTGDLPMLMLLAALLAGLALLRLRKRD